MVKKTVDDIIANGIHGTPELKADERVYFLGTIRERVELALFVEQVAESAIYPEIAEIINKKKNISLLLNGKIPYTHLSKYIKLANQCGVPFSIVNDRAVDTDIGLVIANKNAVDNEYIFVE